MVNYTHLFSFNYIFSETLQYIVCLIFICLLLSIPICILMRMLLKWRENADVLFTSYDRGKNDFTIIGMLNLVFTKYY